MGVTLGSGGGNRQIRAASAGSGGVVAGGGKGVYNDGGDGDGDIRVSAKEAVGMVTAMGWRRAKTADPAAGRLNLAPPRWIWMVQASLRGLVRLAGWQEDGVAVGDGGDGPALRGDSGDSAQRSGATWLARPASAETMRGRSGGAARETRGDDGQSAEGAAAG
ncbi:Os06g0658200 [Oryza sativa Japonica Group]|jgi:hypothetical protein|uniref:Os06g0658200 protein n=2 Tax=Oryza sativa subsp. japonica TaxID=39947 RepID=A0A0P0WZN4_ORYSJ|nr:hypothetical protein EE612_035804 [Oryza sativa]BAD37827.1 hypothetical protein [Oryza sativa Japonica Group]BAD38335.1 hypothetical protein [Oryza sativa Japonica Group]BAH93665.1 Os06g0658200 [Oryza sativa Japonica Group]BAS98956.1 Os06g0658200 [Oryza sativa Japonica Group]|eukprot:NP_001174937.1 Os06g0658200 [Oryza sativa Japonica Group]